MQSTQQAVPLPFATEAYRMVHMIAPPIIHTHVQPYFEDHHQVYRAMYGNHINLILWCGKHLDHFSNTSNCKCNGLCIFLYWA